MWSYGDWGQSQFQLGGDDESAHQILSYGLLFLPFYQFPSTADPLTCTTPMQPSVQLAWSPSTIPYTHCTIGPAPHCRFAIWPMDHIVLFPIFCSFSITWRVLLWTYQSQVITPHSQDLTICFTAHKPCAHFTYHLYLKLLYLLQKRRKFFPQNWDLVHSALSFHLTLLWTFALLRTFNSPHTLAPSWTFALNHLTPCYYTRRLSITPLSHPQSLIGFMLWLSLMAHTCQSSCCWN